MNGFHSYRRSLLSRMERAVKSASERAAQSARGIVPYGEGRDGSHLRDRIAARTYAKEGRFFGDVEAQKHYAVYVELGTSRMAAHPYLRPALKSQRQLFLRELSK